MPLKERAHRVFNGEVESDSATTESSTRPVQSTATQPASRVAPMRVLVVSAVRLFREGVVSVLGRKDRLSVVDAGNPACACLPTPEPSRSLHQCRTVADPRVRRHDMRKAGRHRRAVADLRCPVGWLPERPT